MKSKSNSRKEKISKDDERTMKASLRSEANAMNNSEVGLPKSQIL